MLPDALATTVGADASWEDDLRPPWLMGPGRGTAVAVAAAREQADSLARAYSRMRRERETHDWNT
jgi:hypothetical protein